MTNKLAPATLDDCYLSLKALVAYSSFSRRTLERWLVHPVRPLPHHRSAGRIVVKRSEFDEWMQQFRVVQPPIDIEAMVDAKIHGR